MQFMLQMVNVTRNTRPSLEFLSLEDEIPDYEFVEPVIKGVQLLCLIDKGLDACRYLQTSGEWYQSIWLAKVALDEKESQDVLTRWSDFLSTGGNQKHKSVEVMLSLGQFAKVAESLYSLRYFDQAAMFVEACLEFNLIQNTPETGTCAHKLTLGGALFLEYARYLESVGFMRGMRHYCGKAGEKGKQLLDQHLNSKQKRYNADSVQPGTV
eukprot:Em0013g246a